MPSDVGGEHDSPHRHRLERLERRDELGEAHGTARIGEHVHRCVVPLHLGVIDPAAHREARAQPGGRDARAQRLLLDPATDDDEGERRMRAGQECGSIDQQVDPLVAVQRADEAHDGSVAGQARGAPGRGVGRRQRPEARHVDRVRHHVHARRLDAARDDVGAQPLADRADRVHAAEEPCVEGAHDAPARAALGAPALVRGRILPEGTHLVDHRQAERERDTQRGQDAEARRMSMQQVRAQPGRDVHQAARGMRHPRPLAQQRWPRAGAEAGRAVEDASTALLLRRARRAGADR